MILKKTFTNLFAVLLISSLSVGCIVSDDDENNLNSLLGNVYYISLNYEGEQISTNKAFSNGSSSQNESFHCSSSSTFIDSNDNSLGVRFFDLAIKKNNGLISKDDLESLVGETIQISNSCNANSETGWHAEVDVWATLSLATGNELYTTESDENETNYLSVNSIEFLETEEVGLNVFKDTYVVEGIINSLNLSVKYQYTNSDETDEQFDDIEFRGEFSVKWED